MKLENNILTIESQSELESEMCRYNCMTKEELKNLLASDYGVTLKLEIKKQQNFYTDLNDEYDTD